MDEDSNKEEDIIESLTNAYNNASARGEEFDIGAYLEDNNMKRSEDLIKEHLVYVEGVGWELDCSDEVLDVILEDFFDDDSYGNDDDYLMQPPTKEEEQEDLKNYVSICVISWLPVPSSNEYKRMMREVVTDGLLLIESKEEQQFLAKLNHGRLMRFMTHQELQSIFK